MKWIAVACAVLFVFLFMAFSANESPTAKDQNTLRAAIAHCWSEQARKSLTPAEARFVASACEKLEADFATKYGRKP